MIMITCRTEQILFLNLKTIPTQHHSKIKTKVKVWEIKHKMPLREIATITKEAICLLKRLELELMLTSSQLLEMLEILSPSQLDTSQLNHHKKDFNLNFTHKLTKMNNFKDKWENLKELLKKENH